MFKRRKRKNKTENGTQPGSPPAAPAPDYADSSSVAVNVRRETKAPPLLTDVFKGAIEKALDRSKSGISPEGKMKPMAFFVHADGKMQTVSLGVRDDHQKDVLIRRIREKALAEDIYAVIILTEMDDKHGVLLSGADSGMRVSARVEYAFDSQKKGAISWKISWLNQPVQNVFLDGIFDKAR